MVLSKGYTTDPPDRGPAILVVAVYFLHDCPVAPSGPHDAVRMFGPVLGQSTTAGFPDFAYHDVLLSYLM